MDWTREDLAWAAGLFEGEGCITLKRQSQRGYDYEYWALTLAMTDEDIVRRFLEATHLGRVTGPVTPKGGRKPIWIWRVTKRPEVYALLVALYPWLGERRRARATEALLDIGSRQLKHCEKGHLWIPASAKVRPIRGHATRVCRECLDNGELSARKGVR